MKKRKKVNHTAQEREQAKKMYIRGLSLSEISEILKISVRTLEGWQTYEKWTIFKDCPKIKERAKMLHDAGKTYKEIADMTGKSIRTIARYCKEMKGGEK